MHILPHVDQPTDEPFWISKETFRTYFDQHDFDFYREARVVKIAYHRDWFISVDGVSRFILPIVTFVNAKTQFVNGRHRATVLLSLMPDLPVALARAHLSPAELLLRESIPKRPLLLTEPMLLPDLALLPEGE